MGCSISEPKTHDVMPHAVRKSPVYECPACKAEIPVNHKDSNFRCYHCNSIWEKEYRLICVAAGYQKGSDRAASIGEVLLPSFLR